MEHSLHDCIESISKIIRIDSTQAAPLPSMPFGKGAADCLAYFLNLAQTMGFATKNYDNYIGEVLFGEGEPFAILCHLDVVPAGNGWTYPPFGGEIHGGRLYGRGAMDDKGPAVICLYCLKALMDEGFCPARTIKLIVGCNEESGWECIAHYNKVAQMPREGFSPDADFPAIFAEKGILQLRLEYALPNAPFSDLSGGERANMVCDFVQATSSFFDPAHAETCGVTLAGGTVTARGKSAHASTPEKGDNAIGKILRYFSFADERIRTICEDLFKDRAQLTSLCDDTGALTLSPNQIRYSGDILSITVDIRYPASLSEEFLTDKFRAFGARVAILHHQKPLRTDRDGFLLTTLKRVYEQATGKDGTPIAIGGGTYARALHCGAGFGPQFPDEPSVIHQKDEYISLENIEKLFSIYRAAIFELTKNPHP